MPDNPPPKARAHPHKQNAPLPRARRAAVRYAELATTSNFTFLTGASHPDELASGAAELGHHAVAITDLNTLAGVVRAHVAAKEAGLPLAVGSRLRMRDGLEVLTYATDRASYGRLCRLLTLGKRRAQKGQCHLDLHDLVAHSHGLLAMLIPPRIIDDAFIQIARALKDVFDHDRLSLAAAYPYGPDDRARIDRVAALGAHVGVPICATNDVLYHAPDRRPLQDVLTCVRHRCTIEQAGLRLAANAERHLKPPEEMARLFAGHERALARTVEIADRAAAFSLDQLRYEYPDEVVPPGRTPMQHLTELSWAGARSRFPDGVPDRVDRLIRHELALIEELAYAPYFLTCHDIVAFARSRGILCQGRGAAANSAVCYCLGITSVDPSRIDTLFERFVSRERNEPPDIDIDFEHERREEVIQHIYAKYGRDRAALTAEVISYRGRSAVREVGKAMGLSLDCVDRLAKSLDWWDSGELSQDRLREIGINPADPTLRRVLALTSQIMGFPRHLSQHVGGFVISRGPLCESVPIENAAMPDRTVIEWDKDDIDALGILKIDVLGLGMLSCIRRAFGLVEEERGKASPPGNPPAPLSLADIPAEDPAVYDMLCHADTIGVFQIESRAQMSMLPRLRPRCYYDLVIEVAIVRPGPIQGNMVHPYLRRRDGQETITYPHPDVERVLGKTLGVPLFQEQAMQLAIVAGGFTPGEADQLRRAMAAWKRRGNAIHRFGERLIAGMLARGYPRDFAERCFEQIKGFSEYGFPESHAASFALLVYVSAWLKRYHPAAFAGALINSQPMGFYAPSQIVRDAQDHGVTVRPMDVNHSAWDCTLEDSDEGAARLTARDEPPCCWGRAGPVLRLGTRLARGLRQPEADAIADAVRGHGPFDSIDALWRASRVRVATLRQLARADAFGSMGLDRQRALWHVRALRDDDLPLFDAPGEAHEPESPPALPAIAPVAVVRSDYNATGLSLKAHPVSFIRNELARRHVVRAADLRNETRWPTGRRTAVAGVVTCRQRPSTASGIVFITLEDETGYSNLIVRPRIYERDRRAARHGTILLVRGRVERKGEVVHVQVSRIECLDDLQPDLDITSRDFH